MPSNQSEHQPNTTERAAQAYQAASGERPHRIGLESAIKLAVNEFAGAITAQMYDKLRGDFEAELSDKGARVIPEKLLSDLITLIIKRATIRDRIVAKFNKSHWLNDLRQFK